MCELCGSNPCVSRCPNAKTPISDMRCKICDEYILPDEWYVENSSHEYAHEDCLDYVKDVYEFFNIEIQYKE